MSSDEQHSRDSYFRPSEEERQPLDAFFAPRSVAVIGASDRPGSVGRQILWNLLSSPFGGTVYAVNPKRRNVLGMPACASVASVPEKVDLAVVITPAGTVPQVIGECIEAGVEGAVIISAGFRETGEAGLELEQQVRGVIHPRRIRIIGPNSLGIMNPVSGLNAAFAPAIAHKGTVGFISQSGAVCAAILDWSREVHVGFSVFVSFGTMVDVGWADLIHHLGNDPNTKSIVLYVQTIGDARSFLSAVREVALSKPIILLKAGQTEAAARAARATPYYAGYDSCKDSVMSAALRRSGVLRVDDVESLFAMADALGKQPRPEGSRLTIVSNAAGPGILATDALVNGGGRLADLTDDTMEKLNRFLPFYWNHTNPLDIVADADPNRYAQTIEAVMADANTDGALIILTPQVMTDPTGTARAIAAIPDFHGKPLLATWMGGHDVAEGKTILNENNIPVLPYPDSAARVFDAMWRYNYVLSALYETPTFHPDDGEDVQDRVQARGIVETAREEGRTELNAGEARALFAAYGIAFGPAPANCDYSLILGSSTDPQFGPFLFFGPGGAMGRALRERAIGLPPLNSTLARRMMEHTRLYRSMRDERRVPVEPLEQLLVLFSRLVADQAWVREIEVEPISMTPEGMSVVAARVWLHPLGTARESLPKLAIRPYPAEYATTHTMKNGEDVILRPIRPEDENLMVEFHERLSKDTVYYRFLRLLAFDQRVKHERLAPMCFLDYDRAMAIVAVRRLPETGERKLLGVSRMVKLHGTGDADFAIVVSDDAQGLGLGKALMERLIEVARREKVRRLVGIILPENRPMLNMCRKLGFHLEYTGPDEVVATRAIHS